MHRAWCQPQPADSQVMPTRDSPQFLKGRRLPYAAARALLLAAVEIFVDFDTWIELDVAIVYGLPLVVAGGAGNRRLLWGLTAALVFSTFAVYVLQVPPGRFSLHEPLFLNRVLCALTVVLTALLVYVLMLAMDKLDQQNEELEQRRADAEAASRRKTRLLAAVSHDMSTPLTTINVMAELIRRAAEDRALPADIAGLARTLHANAMSLAEVLSDILDLSVFETGQVGLHETVFALDALLAEECRALEPLAAAKGLDVALEVERPIWVRADRVKLARVVRNLLNNAIKFTAAGRVTAGCALDPAEHVVKIRIADTGVGIGPGDVGRIFDDYARLDSRSPQNASGWGLGLPICRRLVELMEGNISVESAPGHGSVFTVRLPASRLAQAPAALQRTSA